MMRTYSGWLAGLLVLLLLAGCEGLAGPSPDDTPYLGTRVTEDETSIAFVCFNADDEDTAALYRVGVDSGTVQAMAPGIRDARVPRWSGDGRSLVFQADRTGAFWTFLNVEGDEELFAVDANGDHLRALTDNWNDEIAPSWSPNGQWIAFVHRDVYAGMTLMVMRADGSDARALTSGIDLDRAVAWSPNGQKLAFTAILPDDQRQLDVIDAGGVEVRPLSKDARISNLVWSGDGRWIRYRAADDVTVRVSADGAVKEYLDVVGSRNTAIWSPRPPSEAAFHVVRPRQMIPLLRPDDFGVRALINVPIDVTGITESPDSQSVAYASRDYGTGVVFSQIFTMRLDGSGLRQLTNMDCNAFDPQWSPQTR